MIELVLAPGLVVALQHVDAAHDAGQQVVEIMGDTAGELTDRFHLLRLAQLLLQFLLLGDIPAHGIDEVILGCGRPVEHPVTAVAPSQPCPQARGALLAPQAAQGIEHLALIVGVNQFGQLNAGQVRLASSQ